MFYGRFKGVKCVLRFQKKFQGCFKNVSMKVFFCDFVVARISSQLPEQKEGLFKNFQFSSLGGLNFVSNKANLNIFMYFFAGLSIIFH